MKIVHTVEYYEPHKGGAEEVVKKLSEGLARRGHDVTVLTSFIRDRQSNFLNGVKIKSFRINGNLVRGVKEQHYNEIVRYQDFLTSFRGDIILNYAVQQWTTDLTLPLLDSIKAKKILVPCGYSGIAWPKYKQYYEKLPFYLKKYDKLVYMSNNFQDKVFGDKNGLSDKSVIIKNGAGSEFLRVSDDFRKNFKIKTPYMLLNVSNHYFNKGHRFVINAFKKLNRKDVTLVIIGEVNTKLGCYLSCKIESFLNEKIKVIKGISRKDVISAYQAADLFIFGSNIECSPLVMYESFASKTPFITTRVGNVEDYSNIIKIVKTPIEMSKNINRLLDFPEERNILALKAFNIWKDQNTWEKIITNYESLYMSLLHENNK